MTETKDKSTKPVMTTRTTARGRWGWYCVAVGLTVLFVIFTLTVKWVDVQTDGTQNMGWATVNFWWRDVIGVQRAWHVISNIMAAVTFAAVGGLMIWQIVAAVRGGGFRHLARHWWVLDAVLLALCVCYLCFQVVVINYRPILRHGVVEAAYPSSHVLLFATVCPLAIFTVWRHTKNRTVRAVAVAFGVTVMCVGVLARLLSGYHWLTDILGGVGLGAVLVAWYLACTVGYKLPNQPESA